jgi:hypothetical protein
MGSDHNPGARLMVELPSERYRHLSPAHRVPRVGDLLFLDQGFTGPDGLPMAIAYFPGPGDGCLYEAEVYASELE